MEIILLSSIKLERGSLVELQCLKSTNDLKSRLARLFSELFLKHAGINLQMDYKVTTKKQGSVQDSNLNRGTQDHTTDVYCKEIIWQAKSK